MKLINKLPFILVLASNILFSQNPEWVNFTYGNDVYAIAIEGNYVWVGTSGGLVWLDMTTEVMTFYNKANLGLPSNFVRSIAIDGQGNKWIGTGGGLAMFDGSRWTVYNTSNSGLPSDFVRSIAVDGQGNKWIGTWGGGLVMFDGLRWTIYNTSNSGLSSDYVNSIAIDDQGNKWIGTRGGLVKFDSLRWTVYNRSNSNLPSDTVYSIAIDGQGNKWIGTYGGLAMFDGSRWTVYNTSNSGLPSDYVYSIAIDGQGNKWIGTGGGGLAMFDGTRWTVYNRFNSALPGDVVLSIAIDGQGNKWIGAGGLAKFDGSRWTVYTMSNSALPSNNIRLIAIDGQNNKWIGTDGGGLVKFDGVSWIIYNTSNSGLPSNSVNSIAIDGQGNKWIGTSGGGLVVYKEGGFPIIQTNKSNINFGSKYISRIAYDTIKVRNSSSLNLTISEIRINNQVFRYIGTLPIVLRPNDSINIVFSFNPAESRNYVDTISIISNSFVNPVLKIVLTGRGVRPPYVASSVDTLKFGSVYVSDSLMRVIKIYNHGEIDTVRISSVVVDRPFYYVGGVPLFILPNDSANISFKFKPDTAGRHLREVKIISNAWNDTLRVYLDGFANPVVLSRYRVVQSNVVKLIYRVRGVSSLNLVLFEYSTDGGVNWISSSNISGRIRDIGNNSVDTVYWNSRRDLPSFEGYLRVRVKFSSGSNEYIVYVDSVGVDNLSPRFAGVLRAVGDTNRVILSWNRAFDISLPIRYRVYVSLDSLIFDFSRWALEVSDTFAVVSGLDNFRRYYFVVRSVDFLGNEDTNRVRIGVTPGGRSSVKMLRVLGDRLSSDVRIVYSVSSVVGDTVNLRFEYSVDGGSSWREARSFTRLGRDIVRYPYTDTLVWHSKVDTLVETQNCVVRLIPIGLGGVGFEGVSTRFVLDNLSPRFAGVRLHKNLLSQSKIVLYWNKAVDISK
ncbi:MAG: two-component regulator propeller domain-containing protein, partial [Candidatus Kryptonium sp.]